MKVITGKSANLKKLIELNAKDNDIIFPENGLDPEEQANFMLTLNNFDGRIFTFSPWIISDTHEDDLYVIQDNGKLVQLDFNNFGASVNKITMKIFRRATIGEKSLNFLESFKDNIDREKELEKIATTIDNTFGESVEKILFLKYLYDKIDKTKSNFIKRIFKK
jgi:hypothetical protein